METFRKNLAAALRSSPTDLTGTNYSALQIVPPSFGCSEGLRGDCAKEADVPKEAGPDSAQASASK